MFVNLIEGNELLEVITLFELDTTKFYFSHRWPDHECMSIPQNHLQVKAEFSHTLNFFHSSKLIIIVLLIIGE